MDANQIKARNIVKDILGKGVTYADRRSKGKVRYKWMQVGKCVPSKLDMINNALSQAIPPGVYYKVEHLNKIGPSPFSLRQNDIVLTI